MKCGAIIAALVLGVAMVVGPGSSWADEARPVYQVLDAKPANLMLNYFVGVATEKAKQHRPPTSLAEWERRRGELRRRLRDTLGNFPWDDRPPLNARVTGRIDHGDHVVEKVLYESLPGLYVTALAYVPKNIQGRAPAVICVNGHWPDAKATELIQRRCLGLARMGVVAFCQDVIGTGERQAFAGSPPTNYHGFFRGAAPRIVDRSLQGYVMFECLRALDYLCSRSDIDPTKIMCTGASGGGMQSMLFAALDERLAGAVPVCYISSYEVHMGATACVCEVPAGILGYSNQWEILGLHAPRPLLCIGATRDVPVFQVAPMLDTLDKTRRVYKLYGREEAVSTAVVDSGHDYNKEMREHLYRHVAQHLLGRTDEKVTEPDNLPVEPISALSVGLPASTESMQSLTFRRASELAAQIVQPQDAGQWQSLKQAQQRRLRDDILGGFPQGAGGKPVRHRTVSHNGFTVEHWTLTPEPGIVVPATLCLPHGRSAADRRPAVVIADENGKQTAFERGLVDALVGQGIVVLAIDYRGAGETAGTVPAIEYGPGTPDYNLMNYSLFVGRPLAGARVTDIREAVDFLAGRPEVDAGRLAIVGRGCGALSALLAASYDDRLTCVVADEFVTSLVFNEEFVAIGLTYLIPRMLTVADLPQLLAHIAPRPLLVLNPVDGRRRAVAVDDGKQKLRYAAAVYEVLDSAAQFEIAHTDAAHAGRKIAEWIQRRIAH